MNIEIQVEDIERAIQKSATDAIARSMGGYQVQGAIAEVITSEVAQGVVSESIRQALQSVDRTRLVNVLADQIGKSLTAAVARLLQDAAVDMVLKLHGIPDYDSNRKDAARTKLYAEMFGKAAREIEEP